MFNRVALTAVIAVTMVGALTAQTKRAAGPKSVTNNITVRVQDTVYTGTMEMAVHRGKVTGQLRITTPTEVTGTVAGQAKAGVLDLEFPFQMPAQQCQGTVKMTIKTPAKPGPATGTMEAVGCGSDPTQKTLGTVELVPVAPGK